MDSDCNLTSRIEGNRLLTAFREDILLASLIKNLSERSQTYFIGNLPSKTLKYFLVIAYMAKILDFTMHLDF